MKKHNHNWQYARRTDIKEKTGETYSLSYMIDEISHKSYEIPIYKKVGELLEFVCECGAIKKVKAKPALNGRLKSNNR